MELTIAGRYMVYAPTGEGVGVSRRLDDTERTRLKDIIKKLDVKEGGVIVRTAAEGASAEDIARMHEIHENDFPERRRQLFERYVQAQAGTGHDHQFMLMLQAVGDLVILTPILEVVVVDQVFLRVMALVRDLAQIAEEVPKQAIAHFLLAADGKQLLAQQVQQFGNIDMFAM